MFPLFPLRHLLTISLLSLYCTVPALAAVFTVTSGADNGPGTLRDAIMQANANGTTSTDYINFNLPTPTITLSSGLPALSSNIIIDGTTQPGPPLGISNARVTIQLDPSIASSITILQLLQASQIGIYGLAFKHSISQHSCTAIYLADCQDIILGAPGKGNLINGFQNGIYQDQVNVMENITIQGNIIGVEEDGFTKTIYDKETVSCIRFRAIKNILIGGNNPAAGNLIVGRGDAISLETTGGTAAIAFNKIGIDNTGTRIPGFSSYGQNQVNITGNAADIQVTDNLIGNGSIYLFYLKNRFTIQRNKIGTDITGQIVLSNNPAGIQVLKCPGGLIGGDGNNGNTIAGCSSTAIGVSESYAVTISQNSMFCNSNGIRLYWQDAGAGRPAPFVNVTGCDGNGISGIAPPNSLVEIFESTNCNYSFNNDPGNCQGKRYITSVNADASGKWSYTTAGTPGLIVTATDTKGATSEFSTAKLGPGSLQVTHASCGQNNGSITAKIERGVLVHWEDLHGNIVSRDTNLTKMPPGAYTLVLSSGGCNNNSCLVKYGAFEIRDISPAIEASGLRIQNASCGQKNGSISGLKVSGQNIVVTWKNAVGTVVGNTADLSAAGPGSYTLEVKDGSGSCSAKAGPYTITNADGPTIDISRATVTASTCNQANGGISGITISGTGTISYAWYDAGNTLVGQQPNLAGVKSGTYVLKYQDNSNCPQAMSDPFIIQNTGDIQLNTSQLKITPADCRGGHGAIAGIVTSGATSWQWVDQNGRQAGTTADLNYVPAGKYQLLLSNTTGCTNSSPLIEIPTVTPAKMQLVSATIIPPHCGQYNGSIQDLRITGGSPIGYRWTRENGQPAGTSPSLSDLEPGTYQLYVTDADGCEQPVGSQTLKAAELPVMNERKVIITPDQCSKGLGGISNISVDGEVPFTYTWYQDNIPVGQSRQLTGVKAGQYTLTATDQYGCSVQSTLYTVTDQHTGLPTPQIPPVTIVRGMDAVIKVAPPVPGTWYLYTQPVDPNPLYTSTDGTFTIKNLIISKVFYIQQRDGECYSPKVPAPVTVLDAVKVFVPTAFSPNGDGLNDLFRIKALGLASLEYFNVYSRWGNIVFTTRQLQEGWDGTQKGQQLPAGTYVWTLLGKDVQGNIVQQRGTVTLIR